MTEAEIQLIELARAAQHHAEIHHGASIHSDDVASVDILLEHEREFGDTSDRESVILCYGAWWGECLRLRLGGVWRGLGEPIPPRISIVGRTVSPFDAIRRILYDPASPSLSYLYREILDGNSLRPFPLSPSETNRLAWDSKSNDPRFTSLSVQKIDRELARAMIDPWLASERDGQKVLCLAAGGGTHGPLHAMAGFDVTVVDISASMLAIDEKIASQLDLAIRIHPTSMEQLAPFPDQAFDIVVHPVSLSYVPNVRPVYREIARVLRDGGLYVSQQKQPGILQAGEWSGRSGYGVLTSAEDGIPLVPVNTELPFRETDVTEYLHTLDEILGGLCRAGFSIEDFVEPLRSDAWSAPGTPFHLACFFPPYLKIKARRHHRK